MTIRLNTNVVALASASDATGKPDGRAIATRFPPHGSQARIASCERLTEKPRRSFLSG